MAERRRASLLILIRYAPQLQALLVRRAEDQRAFPGSWTFPGGVRDPEDAWPSDARFQLADAPDRQCALRELFEETGVLPGYQGELAELAQAQQALLTRQLGWAEFCRKIGYQPPLAQLQFLGLRVTPPIMPRLFETHYYLLEVPTGSEPLAFSPELAEGGWLEPAQLLARWQRGEALIPPPVLEVLKVLAAEGVNLEALKAQAHDAETLPIPIESHPGIELFPLRTPTLAPATHTNGYLVGGAQFVIVDPASPYPDQQAVLRHVLQRRLDAGDQPLAVLLTHHHRDHIGAACFVRDWLGIPIAAHAKTAELLDFDVDERIEDGQCWDLGQDALGTPWILEAMFTPGHAPGHVCFIDHRHRVALVGDMLAGMGTILIKRPKGHMSQYLASLQQLADAGLTRGFPSHGPMIPDLTSRCREYIRHRQQRNEQIREALASGRLSENDLLHVVYRDLEPQALPLARWSLEAHLHDLQEQGQVQRVGEDWALSA